MAILVINPSTLHAQSEPPQFFSLDGRLFEAGSTTDPLLDSSVVMTVQVLNPSKSCILYEEQQTVNTLGTNGYFNVRVGSGTGATKRSSLDTNNSMNTVFYNRTTAINGKTSGGGACTYTPAAGDERFFRFFITPSTVGSTAQLSPDMTLDSVPQAIVAQTLQGLGRDDVFHTSVTSTQAKLDNLLTTNYTNITDLISGTSTQYLRNAPTGTLLPTRATDPASPAAGQMWYDSATNEIKYYNGTAVTAVGAAGSGISSITAGSGLDGGTITTSGTISVASGGITNSMLASGIDAAKVTTGTLPAGVVPSGTDTTKLPLAGGTLTGAVTMGAATSFAGFDLLGTGHITMNSQRTITIGRYDTTQQNTTLIPSLTGANAGAVWYNSTTGKLMFWNGSAAFEISETTSAGGDITAINTNAGSGLTGGVTSGPATLAINVDGTTLEVATNTVQVKDAGIALIKLAPDSVNSSKIVDDSITSSDVNDGTLVNADINAAAAIAWGKIDKTGATAGDVGAVPVARAVNTNTGSGLSGGGALSADRSLSILVDDSTIEIATNTVQVKDGGITNAKINSLNITKLTQGAGDYFSYMPAGSECATGEVLKWNATSDRWLCDTDAVGATDHGALTGLADDDHTQYVLLAGRAGGQTLRGGTAASNNLTLESTSDATKGDILLQPNGGKVGVGTTAPLFSFHVENNDNLNIGEHIIALVRRDGSGGGFVIGYEADGTSVTASRMRGSGNYPLLIGTNGSPNTMTIGDNGNVGIGTLSPASLLDVAGIIRAEQICDESGANCKDISSGWGAGGDIDGITTDAGSALSGGTASGTATLSVVTDATTIETNGSNQLQIKDSGITSAKIADGTITNADINASAAIAWSKIDKTGATASDVGAVPTTRAVNTNAGSGLTGGGALSADRSLSIAVDDSTIEIATNTVQVKDGGITNNKIASLNITKLTQGAGDYFSYMPAGTECATGEVLKWDATNDRWLCDTDAVGSGDHGALTGLGDDDHTQYVLLAGRSGGQTLRGGTASGDDITIESTSDATKGDVLLQPNGGNVGIGTTSPSGRLQISSSAAHGALFNVTGTDSSAFNATSPNASLTVENTSTTLNTYSGIHLKSGNADGAIVNTRLGSNLSRMDFYVDNNPMPATPSLSLLNGGNVAIGTTTANYPLEVTGYIGSRAADPRFVSYDNSNVKTSPNMTGGLEMRDNANSVAGYLFFDTGDSNTDLYLGVNTGAGNGGLRLQTGGSDRMYINYQGNVGIGSTAPNALLDVAGIIRAEQICDEAGGNCKDISTGWGLGGDFLANGTVPMTGQFVAITGTAGAPSITFNGETNTGIYKAAAGQIGFASAGNTAFKVLGTSSAYLSNGVLRLAGGTVGAPAFSFENDNNTGMYNGGADILNFSTASTERMRIDAAGNVGIGSNAPNAKLDVAGTVRAEQVCDEAGTNCKDLSAGWVDASTLEINGSNQFQVKDGGITSAKINSLNITKLTQGAGDYFSYMPAGTECNTGETLKWNAVTDRWECGTDATGVSAHSGLTGLTADDHTQYVLLAGRSGGQTLSGGTAASENIVIDSTTNSTKGTIVLQPSGGGVAIGTTTANTAELVVTSVNADPELVIGPSGAANSNAYLTLTSKLGGAEKGSLIMTDWAGSLMFKTENDTKMAFGDYAANYMMVLDTSNGRVGIGSVTPTAMLDVAGTVKATAFSGPITSATVSSGAGTNLLPSITFSGDPDTGFYNTSSNDLISVTTGGAKIFDFSSSGLVSPTNGGARVLSSNGTQATPTYSFAGDPDTGWFTPASDTLAASTAGTERLRIDSTGQVGIGTMAPSATLDVAGTLKVSVDVAGGGAFFVNDFSADNTTSRAAARFYRTYGGGTGGAAGIGVTTGWYSEDAAGSAVPAGILGFAMTDVTAGLYDSQFEVRPYSNGVQSTSPFVVTGAGNVGIGTTTPNHNLHVLSSNNNVSSGIKNQTTAADSVSIIAVENDARNYQFGVDGTDADKLKIYDGTAAAARMTITTAGNVGIGTTNPGETLSVNGVIESLTGGIKFPDGTVQTTSATSGSNNTMVSGWPDAIKCKQADGTELIVYINWGPYSGLVIYRDPFSGPGGDRYYQYNYPAGTFNASGGVTNDAVQGCDQSISTVVSNGRGFNFAKGPAAQWLQSGSNAYYNAGSVGIGTSAPMAQTEIYGASQLTANLTDAGGGASMLALNSSGSLAGNGGGILFGNVQSKTAGSLGMAAIKGLLVNGAGNTSGDIAFSTRTATSDTALSEKMRITSSGRLGIGTTAPATQLHIANAGSTSLLIDADSASSANGNAQINFINDLGYLGDVGMARSGLAAPYANSLLIRNQYASGDILFGTGSILPVIFKSSGNVGIGTTSPSNKLEVVGAMRVVNSAGNAISATSTGAYGVYGESSGNYGVYGKSLAYGYAGVLGYDHTSTYYGLLGFNGASGAWAFYGSGSAYISGTYQGSDKRLKENIKPLTSALDVVNRLEGVSFDWRANSEQARSIKGKDYGFIAQDVEKILPEVVREIDSPNTPGSGKNTKKTLNQQLGKFKTVEYTRFIPWLSQAIKELYQKLTGFEAKVQKQMDAQRKQIDALKKENDDLKMRLERIEKKLSQDTHKQ